MKTTAGQNKIIDAHLERKDRVKDCPFCGSLPRLAHTWTSAYWLECTGCGAQVRGTYFGEDYERRAHIKGAKSAVAAWNERVE